MAEISKINVNGTVYDIKDTKMREQLGDIETALDSIITLQEALISEGDA